MHQNGRRAGTGSTDWRYVGYEAYIVGNARSARYRMWSLRLVLLALACLAVAFLLLPFQAIGAAGTAGG